MWKLLRIGAPASVEQGTQAMGMTIMMMLVATFGTDPVAAYGVGTRVLSCVIIPAMGLSIATSALVAQNIGAGRLDRAVRTNRTSCVISFTTLAAAGLILFFAGRALSTFLMPEGGPAIDESATFIHTIAFSFGFIGLQQVLTGTLRGAGDTVAPMIMAIASLFVVRFPLAWVLSTRTRLKVDGIWWAVSISIVVAAIVTGIYFLRGTWKSRRLLEEVEIDGEAEQRQMAMEEGLTF